MQLKNTLGRVGANADKLFHGRLPSFEICNDLILAHSCRVGAVHPITSFQLRRQAVVGEFVDAKAKPWHDEGDWEFQ